MLEENEEEEEKGLYKSYQSKDSVSWIDLEFIVSPSYLFLFGKLIVVLDYIQTKNCTLGRIIRIYTF